MLKWENISLFSENIRLIFFDFSLKLRDNGGTMAETVIYTFRAYIFRTSQVVSPHVCAYVRAYIVAISKKEVTLPTLLTPNCFTG